MNPCIKRVDPNEFHDVQKYFDILDEELRVITKQHNAVKKAFIKKRITKIPGQFLNKQSYIIRQEGKVNQLRSDVERIKLTIDFLNSEIVALENIKSGFYHQYPFKEDD